jgi:hypothetical protein
MTNYDPFEGPFDRTPVDPPLIGSQADVPTPKKPSWLRRHAAHLATGAGLVLFGAIIGAASAGGAPSAAEPQPVKTVTVEVPAAVVVNPCQDVAKELWSMLEAQNNEVTIPLAEGGSEGIDAILNGDFAAADAAIEKINGANAAIGRLTDRVEAVGPEYQRCVAP